MNIPTYSYFNSKEITQHIQTYTHKINTPRCIKPINIRPYRLPWSYQNEIETQITDMKRNNIIRNSVSPFNFPLMVVKKKPDSEGKQKLRVESNRKRSLWINEFNRNFRVIEYFSTLDLASDYHQIKIDGPDVHKTAFSTTSIPYEFIHIPFGLSSTPATFTRTIKSPLMGLEEMCTTYLDDIVVHVPS